MRRASVSAPSTDTARGGGDAENLRLESFDFVSSGPGPGG